MAAETIGHLAFPSIRDRTLGEIWLDDPAFNHFRGTAWMQPPCSDCAFRQIDWGGCRCQALSLTGDASAADPVCSLSPHHDKVVQAVPGRDEKSPDFVYRQMG